VIVIAEPSRISGMISLGRIGHGASGVKGAVLLLALAGLTACTSTARLGGAPDQTVAAPPPASTEAPPPPAPPAPPPVDLAGKWKLSAAGAGGCFVTLGNTPNTVNTGTIAPAGGCPGNFFTSRKWSFEDNLLNIRDHKGNVLAQLSFADGGFNGKDTAGGAIILVRP
jgi:Protease inhibitor Inh